MYYQRDSASTAFIISGVKLAGVLIFDVTMGKIILHTPQNTYSYIDIVHEVKLQIGSRVSE